ncbi:MAG TPA: hypothetical protein VHX63_11215 [Acidobacteriaceae bacterium]|nr:hypothetical protein [Acidobacteriaceae bacterium]
MAGITNDDGAQLCKRYQVVPQSQYRNFLFAGWMVQRNIGKKLTLETEIFSHQKEGLANPQTKSATMVDFGGYYNLKDIGLQLLSA